MAPRTRHFRFLSGSRLDEWYHPHTTPLLEALGGVGIAPFDIVAVILSHLHFDHCGQQGMLAAPAYVQATEFEAARTSGYTVPEWAAIPEERLRLVHGDETIAEGICLLSTPGHSPGHQSVLIEAGEDRVVVAAQCAYRAEELRSGQPSTSNLYDESWLDVAQDSLRRIRALAPCTAHLSHDPEIVAIVG